MSLSKDLTKTSRVMSIDFGSKRIGVALSDEAGKIAFPHSIVSNNGKELEEVSKIAMVNSVKVIVVGESKN